MLILGIKSLPFALYLSPFSFTENRDSEMNAVVLYGQAAKCISPIYLYRLCAAAQHQWNNANESPRKCSLCRYVFVANFIHPTKFSWLLG